MAKKKWKSFMPGFNTEDAVKIEVKHLDYWTPVDEKDTSRRFVFAVNKEILLKLWDRLLLEENSIIFDVEISVLDSYRSFKRTSPATFKDIPFKTTIEAYPSKSLETDK